jgi:uncharacterized protein DUF5615
VRIRLYFDEDSARRSLARELRIRGADVVTAPEAGMGMRNDEEQLEWAAANNRAIYSFNRGDFYRLHTRWLHEGRSHSGLILSRQDLPIGEQMRRLLRLINRLTADEMQNRVEFLSAWVDR